jgi:hypothetical protein
MRKILIALVALCTLSAGAAAESIYYGRQSPDQVRVRVGSPEFSVKVRVPMPQRGDDRDFHRGHRHHPGCGHMPPQRRQAMPSCGQRGCGQPQRRVPVAVQGVDSSPPPCAGELRRDEAQGAWVCRVYH